MTSLRAPAPASTRDWSQEVGAIAEPEAQSPDVKRLLVEMAQREGRPMYAFLLYENKQRVLPRSHPVWTASCLYMADTLGESHYLGAAQVLKGRVRVARHCSGHEHLGVLIRNDPNIRVFAVPTPSALHSKYYDGVFIPMFPALRNVAYNPRVLMERQQARIGEILRRINKEPGIFKTHAIARMGAPAENLLDGLVRQGLVHFVECISKKGRPCRRFFPGAGPSTWQPSNCP